MIHHCDMMTMELTKLRINMKAMISHLALCPVRSIICLAAFTFNISIQLSMMMTGEDSHDRDNDNYNDNIDGGGDDDDDMT